MSTSPSDPIQATTERGHGETAGHAGVNADPLFKILNASLSLNVMSGLVTVVVALPMSKKPLTLTVGVLSVRVPMAGPLLLGEILVSKFLRSYLLE